MRAKPARLLLTGAALLALGACETSKSANPLSPSVAGPIPGVNITAPRLLQPGSGANVDATAQPITLVIENASTNGVRPLTYRVEVALDQAFANKVYTREGIAPGGSGQTSLRLTDALAADRSYYWRARAQDGANTGPFAGALKFTVQTPIEIEPPALSSPAHNAVLPDRTPTFVFSNARRSGPVGPITYNLQVARDQAFSKMAARIDVPEGLPNTRRQIESELAAATKYYWRVRATEGSARHVVGPWSATRAFTTVAAPVEPPTPPSPPPAGGPYPSNGPGVIEYVTAHWPSYLRPVSSLDARKRNMDFLRDRVIETGLCGGMRVAWNLKRGGPTLSNDYITHYQNGRWIGVDIAYDYSNYRSTLRLGWLEQPNDPYATTTPYTRSYSCH